MLQTFLQNFVPAMEQVVMLAVPLGVLYAILSRFAFAGYARNYRTAIKWGFWFSILIVVARVGARNAVSREAIAAGSMAIAIVAEIVIVACLLKKPDVGEHLVKPFRLGVVALGAILFFYHGMELWLIPVASIRAATGAYLSAAFAAKSGGFVAGAAFGGISSYVAYRAAKALNDRRLVLVFAIQAAAMLLQQGIMLIQVLMARQAINVPGLLSVMAPVIDHASWLIFMIFFALLFVPLALFSQKKPPRAPGQNPAQYRRAIVGVLHKRRWGTATVVLLALMALASSFGWGYANRKAELAPAVPLTATGDVVQVPLEQVSDGHLHRFSYSVGGTQVRFIAILKGGSAYGVGLDACEICGPTGYYERDGQVICKLCDVMMNKATIGVKGGCNPIPLAYSITGGALTIKVADLEAARKVFG